MRISVIACSQRSCPHFFFFKEQTMTAQRIAIGTVVGGVVFFVLGFLVFGIALADFFASNSAPNLAREPIDFGNRGGATGGRSRPGADP